MARARAPRDIRIATHGARRRLLDLVERAAAVDRASQELEDAWAAYYRDLDTLAGEGTAITLVAETGERAWKAGRYVQRRGAGVDDEDLIARLRRIKDLDHARYITEHVETTYTVNLEAVRADARANRRLATALRLATSKGTPKVVRIPPSEATPDDVHEAKEHAAAAKQPAA